MKSTKWMAMVAVVAALALAIGDADARRLGGGRSMGAQRQSVAPPATSVAPRSGAAENPVMPANPSTSMARPSAPASAAAAPAAPVRSGMSRWLGPIAGIAAGIGLAALLSHFGLSETFASFLLIALVVVAAIFLLRLLFARRSGSTMRYATSSNAPASTWPDAPSSRRDERVEPVFGGTGNARTAARVPPGFDREGFLRQARVQFKALQAAWDEADLDTIADVTTPQMLEEVRRDLADRRGPQEPTHVLRLDADLLEVATEGNQHWASVRFSGLLREEGNDAPKPFDETWNLVKPVDGSSGWLLAGIQQNESAATVH